MFELHKPLPAVHGITGLDSSCTCFLPNLAGVIGEPWRRPPRSEITFNDMLFMHTIMEYLPPNVKNVLIFEDYSDSKTIIAAKCPFTNFLATPGVAPAIPRSCIIDSRIGKAFAERSTNLEQLLVGYMVNAKDFFR
ncbi:hypothetical protein B0T14DRAFT_565949 [Immersiella caudata]|uniref:DUF6546 domain-containing protein n=1 Tax=Immersiella caudata TaxID=314043 RepID=A0AA39WP81_9PEZI|nr:hypothetical protein B0T14DRAFT_565949 [Immersiella caudata]